MVVLKVLFRDENVVAVYKPSGMMVHYNQFDRHSPVVVQTLRKQLGTKVYPVHRLDRATSGVMLLGLNSETTKSLCEAFENREVIKLYVAIVRGHLDGEKFIDRPIVDHQTKQSQAAQTSIMSLAKVTLPIPVGRYPEARYSMVAVRPWTGRRHQIRRHLRGIDHPIIGDTRLGDGTHNVFFRERFQSNQLLLTAVSLQFQHPFTKEWVEVKAPLDGEFLRVGEFFSWRKGLGIASRLTDHSFGGRDFRSFSKPRKGLE